MSNFKGHSILITQQITGFLIVQFTTVNISICRDWEENINFILIVYNKVEVTMISAQLELKSKKLFYVL